MRSAEGRSRKAIPPDTHPERVQVPENFAPDISSVEAKDVCHVLHHRVARSKLANDSELLAPKHSLGVAEAFPLAGGACPLAREAADDDGGAGGRSNPNCSDVVVDRPAGPAEPEDVAAVGFSFAEPGVLEAREVESVVEEPAAGEKRADIHRTT